MIRSTRTILALAMLATCLAMGAAYRLDALNASTKVARKAVPHEAAQVWEGSVTLPGGKRVYGTVYEVTDQAGHPVARYTVEAGNPVPHVVRF